MPLEAAPAAPADEAPAPPAPPASAARVPVAARRWTKAAIGGAIFLALAALFVLVVRPMGPPAKSVAVTPFENLSPDGGQEWFAGGLTEELMTTLARATDLEVARAAFDDGASAEELADEFDVAHVLRGSVRRDSGRVRVSAQLLRADGVIVWSESYDRPDADMIGIQEAIAFEIARALRTVTDPQMLARMLDAGTRSVGAYEALLAGHHFLNRQYATGESSYRRQAYESYERARSIDPGFSEAHWLAARYWMERSTFLIPAGEEQEYTPAEISDLFNERIDAAIATAPDETTRWKYEAARNAQRLEIRRAHRLLDDYLKTRPSDPYAWVLYAQASSILGDHSAGRRAATALSALSDRDPPYMTRVVPLHLWAHDVEGAAREARRLLAKAPDSAIVRYHAHRAFLAAGETALGASLLPQIEASDMPLANRRLALLRQVCAEGDIDRARTIGDEIVAAEDGRLATSWLALSMLGEEERANALIADLDRPDALHLLAAWMTFPQFDAAAFPALKARLEADGIAVRPPARPAYDCPRPVAIAP